MYSQTGGNPFLVRELARMLAEQDRRGPGGPGEAGPVPGRVVEATAYRLAQVSDPARALLQTAAVAGNSSSAGVVARMLDVPVLTLLGPLDECRAAGFLVAGDRPGDHRFSHALVRSAVAAGLSAAEQRRLHTAAADAIEALYEGHLDQHLAEVAQHRVEASLPGDRTRAVAACEAAADLAQAPDRVRRLRRDHDPGGPAHRDGRRRPGRTVRPDPAHLRPDAVDTTRGVATVFPALTLALIRLHHGDRSGTEAAYALAGPVQSWNPSAGMRLSCWAAGLAVAIPLGRADDIELLAARFGPFRGQHVANGAGPGVYMGPVELQLGQACAALGHLDAAVADLETAASVCDTNGAHGYAVQARVELADALGRRQAPGDLGRARAALDAAADAAEQLGMVPFSERIRQLRARR